MLIVAGNALGFFIGSGSFTPFLFDLFDFCKSFREENNTTIKVYISHDVHLSMKCTTSSKETIFLTFEPHFDMRSCSVSKIE